MATCLIHNALLWQWNDTIKYEGKVSDSVGWIAIKHGKIMKIGFENPPAVFEVDEPFTRVIDGQGRLLLPGLMDSHIHNIYTSESQYFLDFSNCNSIEELQAVIRDGINKNSELYWIQGVNWDQTKLKRYPTRADLDEVCLDKPLCLWRSCWHILVCNTKALELAKVDMHCMNPIIEGGIIDTDEFFHGPTGILRERAVGLITDCFTQNPKQLIKKYILDGMKLCGRNGLVAIQTNDEGSYQLYKELQEENQLDIRIFLTPNYSDLLKGESECGIEGIPPSNPLLDSAVTVYDDQQTKLIVNRVKIFTDGSLGAETAAIRLTDQLEDTRQYKGVLMYGDEELCKMIAHSKSLGYRLEIHAIGDQAAYQVIQALKQCHVTPDDRAIITHCQVLGSDLIEEMATYGIIANIQPSFVPTDMVWVRNRIPEHQVTYSYVWKTLMYSGVHVAGGSDAPIESCSPWEGIYDAMYRHHRLDKDDIFHPNERLTFAESLWLYTKGSAYAAGVESLLGSIEVGYLADFVMVDPSIVTDHTNLKQYRPDLVIVGGAIVCDNQSDLSTELGAASQTLLSGNYIPGKNGIMRSSLGQCSCILRGKNCKLNLRPRAESQEK